VSALVWTPDRIVAVVAGGALLLFLHWFFFGKKRAAAVPGLSGGPASEATIVVSGGYDPDLIVARRGMPLTLVFDRREESPCSDEIVMPEFGVRRSLPAHARTAIRIVPARAGDFPFTCGMNMLHGTIRVLD
jgi:plastocyanin domain-containing protein